MLGFYLILGANRSLAQVGKNVGAVRPCAIHYFPKPHPYKGEPHEIIAEGDTNAQSMRIGVASYVEEDVAKMLYDYFRDRPVKIYALTYRDPEFFGRVAPQVLDDPLVWVLKDSDIVSGHAFLQTMRTSQDWIG